MAFRYPGHEPKDYPESDIEKLDILMEYLFKNRSSPVLIDDFMNHLGWSLNDIEKVNIRRLLEKTENIECKLWGISGEYCYQMKDSRVILGIDKYKSYSAWIAAEPVDTKYAELERELKETQLILAKKEINRRPTWKERHWFWIAAFAYVMGFVTDILKEVVIHKMNIEKIETKKTIPKNQVDSEK